MALRAPPNCTLDDLRLNDFSDVRRIASHPDFFYPFLNQNRRAPWFGALRFMWLCCWTRWRRPRHWLKAIRAAPDRRLIGCVLILDLHVAEAGLGEVAYFIAAPEHGQGIGSAAVASVVRWAYQHHGLRRLRANVDPENRASLAILQKIGMCEGRYISPSHSRFSDRDGTPRPYLELSGQESDLAAALARQPPEHDLPVT